MASERKIAANRRNAAKSTGPRTAEGKARSRMNALRHGLATAGASEAAESFQGESGQDFYGSGRRLAQIEAHRNLILGEIDHFLELSRFDDVQSAMRRLMALERYRRQIYSVLRRSRSSTN